MLTKFLSPFRKATQQKGESLNEEQGVVSEGWHRPLTAEKLLNTTLRQQYLTSIWQNVSMSPEMFNKLYRQPIEKYAEMVQLLPASESHHHSHLGGMLDHGLEVISIASKLRQSYVLPQNAVPEEQARQRDVWTAVVIYSALVHDIGKVATDIEVVLQDGSRWFPWQGVPTQPYNFRYIKGRDYNLHPTLGGFFFSQLIPKEALNWIAPFPQAFAQLMYFASSHTDKAGILGEIIQKADQFSVTMALGGEISKLSEKPKTVSFAKQLQIALREVVSGYKLNTSGGGEAWLTEDALWVMSKTTADRVRVYLLGQGISAPNRNGAIFDELTAHKLVEVTENNTAIWNAEVQSESGWKGKFTLLKISPSIIWDNVDQRPALFAGSVFPVEKGNQETVSDLETLQPEPAVELSMSMNEVENATDNLVETAPVLDGGIETGLVHSDSDIDMVLDLFSEDIAPQMDTTTHIEINNCDAEYEIEPVIQSKPIEINDEPRKPSIVRGAEQENDIQGFIDWVRSGVMSGKLLMNQNNAKLHFVENHLFMVTPSIFQLYSAEVLQNTDKKVWETLQKQFQNLSLHKRCYTADGDSRNIWTCKIAGPNRTSSLNGYIIEDVKRLVGEKLVINNQWLTLVGKIQ